MTSPVVNYSDLSKQKKQQFMNFLLNNNIEFQEGRDNYIAKITLQNNRTANKQNKQNRDLRRSHSPISNSNKTPVVSSPSVNKSKRPLQSVCTNVPAEKSKSNAEKVCSPLKINSRAKATQSKNSTIGVYQNPISQRDGAEQVQKRQRQRSKSANAKRQEREHPSPPPVNTNHSKMSKHLRLRTQSSEIKQTKQSKQRVSSSINLSKSSVKASQNSSKSAIQQKAVIPLPVKPQIQYDIDLLNSLLKSIRLPEATSRATRWPRSQVLKMIEQIYTGNYNLRFKNRKFKEACQKGNYSFMNYFREHLEQKYKTPKLIHLNAVNFLHSILSYMSDGQTGYTSLTTFYKFLTQQYESEDLTYFLFVRGQFEKQFNVLMEKVCFQTGQQYAMTRKEVCRLIKSVLGKDETATEYQGLVTAGMEQPTTIYTVLLIMMEAYQNRRKSRPCSNYNVANQTNTTVGQTNRSQCGQPKRRKPAQHQKTSRRSLFQEASSSNFQQLTFGDYNLSHKLEEEDQTAFWLDPQPFKCNTQDPLMERLYSKLFKKVTELVQIVFEDDVSMKQSAKQLHKLVYDKASRMMDTVQNMDKVRWFQLIRVGRPTSQQLSVVQDLQISLRNLRKLNRTGTPEQIRAWQSEFCKSLLTVEQLKKAIQRILNE